MRLERCVLAINVNADLLRTLLHGITAVQRATLTCKYKVHEQKHTVLDLEEEEIKTSIVPDAKIQQLHPIVRDARY